MGGTKRTPFAREAVSAARLAKDKVANCHRCLCKDGHHVLRTMCSPMQQSICQLLQCSVDRTLTRIMSCTLIHGTLFLLLAIMHCDRECSANVALTIHKADFRNRFALVVCIAVSQTVEALCCVSPIESGCSSHVASVQCDQRKHAW